MGTENGIKLMEGMLLFPGTIDGVKITDVKEFDSTDIITEDPEPIDIPLRSDVEVSGEIRFNKQTKKYLLGFGNCKGPARCRAIYKYLKLHRRQQAFMASIISGILKHPECIQLGGVAIDITGLPCTDFIEWVWMQVGAENYEEYRRNKLKRIERGRTRASRHNV